METFELGDRLNIEIADALTEQIMRFAQENVLSWPAATLPASYSVPAIAPTVGPMRATGS
jgi:hypothetical protein